MVFCIVRRLAAFSPPTFFVTRMGSLAALQLVRMAMQSNNQIALKISEACAAARIGRTAMYELIKSGELPARKRGRSTLILASDLRRWLESLPPLLPESASGRG